MLKNKIFLYYLILIVFVSFYSSLLYAKCTPKAHVIPVGGNRVNVVIYTSLKNANVILNSINIGRTDDNGNLEVKQLASLDGGCHTITIKNNKTKLTGQANIAEDSFLLCKGTIQKEFCCITSNSYKKQSDWTCKQEH